MEVVHPNDGELEPISNAEVKIEGQANKSTDDDGQISYSNISEGFYDYYVNKDGYENYEGEINLDRDELNYRIFLFPEVDRGDLAEFPSVEDIDLTSETEIVREIDNHRPIDSNYQPDDVEDVVGASHVRGRYHLTDQPYLLEGAQKLKEEFNSRSIMVYFQLLEDYHPYHAYPEGDYPYNSDWDDLGANPDYLDLAQSEYFQELFDMDFSTFFLTTRRTYDWRGNPDNQELFREIEEEIYELSKYLLETYSDRDVDFVLKNWEGDWLVRTNQDAWEDPRGLFDDHPEIKDDFLSFIHWYRARQRGVMRARDQVHNSQANVLHASEINLVFPFTEEVPTLLTHVLPYVNVDLISYSSYEAVPHWQITDGYDLTQNQTQESDTPWQHPPDTLHHLIDSNPENLWYALDIIDHFAQSSQVYNDDQIYIGEIGIAENVVDLSDEEIINWWDDMFGVMFAQDVRNILQWQVYCNEVQHSESFDLPDETYEADDLNGFWLLKPNGELSVTGKFFKEILKN